MKTLTTLAAILAYASLACSSSSTPSAPSGSDAGGAGDTSTAPPGDSGNTDSSVTDSSVTDSAATDGSGTDGTTITDTWANYAQGFFQSYCVECHNATDATGRDFTMYAKVFSEKSVIRCGVCVTQDPAWACPSFPPAQQFPISDGKTPPNPKPTDAERNRIVAWITAGAPQ